MKTIAIIGGTGAGALFAAAQSAGSPCETPFGPTSGPIEVCEPDGARSTFCYLARHGVDGSIPPHAVNYRANVWALQAQRPDFVIAINAVGGITADATPGRLCVPDQLIDYTWGRAHTFSAGLDARPQHIEFTAPFDAGVRARLVDCARDLDLNPMPNGTYGVTQGPRLETAAEIDRLDRDGCTIVGMTAMPEAALARELGLPYACCAVVVNRAAGRGDPGDSIHAQVQRALDGGMEQVGRLLRAL